MPNTDAINTSQVLSVSPKLTSRARGVPAVHPVASPMDWLARLTLTRLWKTARGGLIASFPVRRRSLPRTNNFSLLQAPSPSCGAQYTRTENRPWAQLSVFVRVQGSSGHSRFRSVQFQSEDLLTTVSVKGYRVYDYSLKLPSLTLALKLQSVTLTLNFRCQVTESKV